MKTSFRRTAVFLPASLLLLSQAASFAADTKTSSPAPRLREDQIVAFHEARTASRPYDAAPGRAPGRGGRGERGADGDPRRRMPLFLLCRCVGCGGFWGSRPRHPCCWRGHLLGLFRLLCLAITAQLTFCHHISPDLPVTESGRRNYDFVRIPACCRGLFSIQAQAQSRPGRRQLCLPACLNAISGR